MIYLPKKPFYIFLQAYCWINSVLQPRHNLVRLSVLLEQWLQADAGEFRHLLFAGRDLHGIFLQCEQSLGFRFPFWVDAVLPDRIHRCSVLQIEFHPSIWQKTYQ